LTDDQGPWAAGCYGNPEIRTPNIDRLAEAGMLFENFFCVSPVCSPARATLLTGRVPSQHGVHDWIRHRNMPPNAARYLEGFTCYTDILAENGYTCGLSGKWHLGDSVTPQHGLTNWLSIPFGGSRYNDAEICVDGKCDVMPGYLTDLFTDHAIRFIEDNREGPFYLSLHYNAPHSPWDGHPQEIVDSYDDCPFKSCPQEAAHPDLSPWLRGHLGNRESLKGYFAATTAMDIGVGRVLDKVEQLGLRDSTLIIFTSDNGYSCGHHGFWGKGNGTRPLNMYENSIKVPFVASQPGIIPHRRRTDAMMTQYDFLPTLLDYLDVPFVDDGSLPGCSYRSVWMGEESEARDEVVVYDEYGPVRMIRTHDWKYVHRYPYGPHELWDLVNDPGERRNLIDERQHAALVEEMRARMARWFERYVDPQRDGLRANVTGIGQKEPINAEHPAEDAGTDEPMYSAS
jgi:arylsulfatase A-like enzyme